MHDLVIRNGLIIDGTGAERYGGDIAIDLFTWRRYAPERSVLKPEIAARTEYQNGVGI